MKKYGYICAFWLMLASFGIAAYGQGDSKQTIDASYDTSLKIVVGSNGTGKSGDLGQDLAGVSRQLRSTFPFASYRLAGTFVGRISNTGNYEYKSVSDIFEPAAGQRYSPTFLEWSLNNLRSGQTAKGENAFQVQQLRFGARVPVVVDGDGGEAGKRVPGVSYESIGLSLVRINLAEGTPTLIGTINLPGSEGTMFLVMTISPADR
ncbi:MAG: hypothetical protein IPG67_08175 [Acidobacteria bacterium]|nr:hypothetical protein [Acidobacteriota bacterium]